MRKYLLLLLLAFGMKANSQTQIDSITVKQVMKLAGTRVTGISDDTTLSNQSSQKLLTERATKALLQARLVGKVDTLYRVNDSTIGFVKNGSTYTFKIQGKSGDFITMLNKPTYFPTNYDSSGGVKDSLATKLARRDSNQYITPTAQATAINSVRLNGITTPYEGYLHSSTGWTIDQDGYFSGMASLANNAYSAGDANNATRAQKNQNNRRLAVSVNGNYASDSGNVVIAKSDISGLQTALDSNLKKNDTTGIRPQLQAGNNISITGSYPTLTITAAAAQTTDTTSLSNRINTKLNTADTASMLSAYSNAINVRVKYSDTSNMLNGYLRKNDTLQYATVINAKLNIADTTNICPRLTAGTNITSITGTYPNLTINAANQTTDISGKADKTTTVNGYPLSSNVTIGKNNISGLQTALDSNLKKTNNLSDLASASTARSNLGLGSVAVRSIIDTTLFSNLWAYYVRAAQNSGIGGNGVNGQLAVWASSSSLNSYTKLSYSNDTLYNSGGSIDISSGTNIGRIFQGGFTFYNSYGPSYGTTLSGYGYLSTYQLSCNLLGGNGGLIALNNDIYGQSYKIYGLSKIILGSNVAANNGAIELTGDLALEAAGNKMKFKEGTNASRGVATLSSGTITVNTTAITANSRVYLTLQNCASCGTIYLGTVTAATSFVINSTNSSDGSIVFWEINDKF